MSKALITESLLTAIADAIRAKTGGAANLTPAEMAAEIANISGGDLPIDFISPSSSVTNISSNDITALRQYALSDLPYLDTVNLPNAVEGGHASIGNCERLKTVNMPKYNPQNQGRHYILQNCPQLETVNLSSLEYVLGYCFQNSSIGEENTLTLPSLLGIGGGSVGNAYSPFESFTCYAVNLPEVLEMAGSNCFKNSTCKRLYAPKCTDLRGISNSSKLFNNNNQFERVEFPALSFVQSYAATFSETLVDLDAGGLSSTGTNFWMAGATRLTNLVLRKSNSVCSLVAATHINQSTPIYQGTGHVYVPRALISTYQTATNWSTIYASNPDVFRAIEDWSVDGTLTGRMDWDKIEADAAANS